jgi:hypothetical protein
MVSPAPAFAPPHAVLCSRRADPLAAWTNSLDLAAVVADTDRAFLILETGFNDRWRWVGGRVGGRVTEGWLGWPRWLPALPAALPACVRPWPMLHVLSILPCRYGAYRRTLETTAEAQAWEQAKQAVG